MSVVHCLNFTDNVCLVTGGWHGTHYLLHYITTYMRQCKDDVYHATRYANTSIYNIALMPDLQFSFIIVFYFTQT